MKRIRVLLADDHSVVRKGLRMQLQQQEQFEVVAEAADGRQAVQLAETENPDVVIMDVVMPGLGGIEATAQIVKRNPKTGVVIFSMHADDTYLSRALAAGAKGYLLKDGEDLDLVRAVEAAAEGKPFFSPTIAGILVGDYMRQLQQRGLQHVAAFGFVARMKPLKTRPSRRVFSSSLRARMLSVQQAVPSMSANV